MHPAHYLGRHRMPSGRRHFVRRSLVAAIVAVVATFALIIVGAAPAGANPDGGPGWSNAGNPVSGRGWAHLHSTSNPPGLYVHGEVDDTLTDGWCWRAFIRVEGQPWDDIFDPAYPGGLSCGPITAWDSIPPDPDVQHFSIGGVRMYRVNSGTNYLYLPGTSQFHTLWGG